MHISNGTIDCWLYVHGHAQNETSDSYSDFQHHHWAIMSSGLIGMTVGNNPSYIWTLNGYGHDNNGSWSATNLSKTSYAQVRVTSSTTVSLTQTVGFGMNQVHATGSSGATSHWVPEQTWPTDLTWSPTATTPSSITYKDPGGPSYHLLTAPVAVPSGQRAFGKNVLALLQSMSLVPGSGFGGRDWTQKSQWFQKPAVVTATAWWAWNINLIP
jgi:hypothetical protein